MFDNDIELARHRVAAQSVQGYTKRAIIAGEWDAGSLVQDALEMVRQERAAMHESNPDD